MTIINDIVSQSIPNVQDKQFQIPLQNGIKKIASIVKQIFDILRTIALFPSRYLGSKFWSYKSGYHFRFEKTLSSDELEKYMPYAYVNASANNAKYDSLIKLGYKLINPLEISTSAINELEPIEDYFFDPDSGLKVILFEKDNNVILGFGALDSSKNVVKSEKQYKAMRKKGIKDGLFNLLGGKPNRYSQAENFVKTILTLPRFFNKSLTLSGNCIGGSIASYTALKLEIPAVCINPLPLGAGMQSELGKKSLERADQCVTNISIQSDWASNPFILSKIDLFISLLGVRTPGNFGRRYSVPTQFGWDFCSTHVRVLTSLTNHLKSK